MLNVNSFFYIYKTYRSFNYLKTCDLFILYERNQYINKIYGVKTSKLEIKSKLFSYTLAQLSHKT